MSSSGGSVTHWVGQLKVGDPAAAQQLWERYFQRLVSLARGKLHGMRPRAADEEDVALSAFDSFCRGVERGQFTQLSDRNNLWRLLVVITARKALDLKQHEARQKRGGSRSPLDEAALGNGAAASTAPSLEQIIGREPTPDFAAQAAEECERLLHRLESAQLRQVALWKMEGYSIDEIAAKLDCSPRTVDRKLWVIRRLWGEDSPS